MGFTLRFIKTKNMNTFNQYTRASKSLSENIVCALETINKFSYQAIIKHLENKEHTYPVKKVSNALNDPFNWTYTTQFHRSEEEINKAIANSKNETEKDLILKVFSKKSHSSLAWM
jgi:hypothetical protein